MTDRELIQAAMRARENAYAPYSRFCVGAALLCKDGSLYTGCNIENAAYAPTNCAERTAFFGAVNDGKRDFSAIAIVGGEAGGEFVLCTPCGVCRQVMAEFCTPDFRVVLGDDTQCVTTTLGDLLPLAFSLVDRKGDML